jgi:hypothetical protein
MGATYQATYRRVRAATKIARFDRRNATAITPIAATPTRPAVGAPVSGNPDVAAGLTAGDAPTCGVAAAPATWPGCCVPLPPSTSAKQTLAAHHKYTKIALRCRGVDTLEGPKPKQHGAILHLFEALDTSAVGA